MKSTGSIRDPYNALLLDYRTMPISDGIMLPAQLLMIIRCRSVLKHSRFYNPFTLADPDVIQQRFKETHMCISQSNRPSTDDQAV